LTTSSCSQCDNLFYPLADACDAITANSCTTSTQTSNDCTTCDAGKYRASATACTAPTSVDDCSTYSTSTDACTACTADFYFVNATTCTARTVTVDTVTDCTSFKANEDVCIKCGDKQWIDY